MSRRALTESTEDGVRKAVAGSQFPLSSNEHSDSRDKKEVANVDVGDGDTSPLHET